MEQVQQQYLRAREEARNAYEESTNQITAAYAQTIEQEIVHFLRNSAGSFSASTGTKNLR
jgi:hypothetical protein